MTERGEETLTGDGWKASWKNVNSNRFDSKAFKADHADLYTAYSKPTTTCRFLISA
jgi:predicted phage-related endonuclease